MVGINFDRTRAGTAVLVAGLVAGLGACDTILEVNDPDVVTPEQLEGPAGVQNKLAGMIHDFREMYDDYVNYSGLLADEFVLGGTFPTRLEVDERRPLPDNGSIEGDVYTPLQVSRTTTDDNAELFSSALGDPDFENVQSSVRRGIALAKLFGGYDRVFFAEIFCQSIFGGPDGEPGPVLPADRMSEAISLLQEAVSAGQDAGMTSGSDDVVSAAKVGQGRALMFLGRYQEAASAVSDVATDHLFPIDFSANTQAEENEVFGRSWGVTFNLRWTVGNGEDGSRHFEKYPYYDEWVSQNLIIPPEFHGRTAFGSPNRPVSIETVYGGPNVNAGNGKTTPIPLSTGWEARMIEAEAMLRNGQEAQAEDMVNDLLTSPEVNPLLKTEPALANAATTGETFGEFEEVDFLDNGGFDQGDLRDMARARAAGLWIQGTRQGTLRRLYRNDGIDMYPTGDDVGDAMSLPVVQQEIDNNSNVSQGCPNGNMPGKG